MKPTEEQVSSKDYIALLRDVLETNDRIVKQNALIVQSLTLPHLIIRPQGDGWDDAYKMGMEAGKEMEKYT